MNKVMQASTQNDKRNIITVDQNYTYMFKNYSEYVTKWNDKDWSV